VIVLAGKKRLRFQFGDIVLRSRELAVQLFEKIVLLLGIGFFLREMDIGLYVAGDRGEFFVRGDLLFGALPLAQNALCGFLIVPEVGISDPRFEGFQALALLRRVKDSSARA
jgi:hypothetical protein